MIQIKTSLMVDVNKIKSILDMFHFKRDAKISFLMAFFVFLYLGKPIQTKAVESKKTHQILLKPGVVSRQLEILEPKVMIPMKGSTATAAYGLLKNKTNKELLVIPQKALNFKAVEAHESYERDGKMGMRKVEEFRVPAHGELSLQKGGNHIMLFEASKEWTAGEKLSIELTVNGKMETHEFVMEPRVASPDSKSHP